MSRINYVDYLRTKSLPNRLTEFFNDCHEENSGRFCSKHGVTHAKSGTPGGTRAGQIEGTPGTQLATAKPSAKGSKYKAGDLTRLGFDTIPDDAVADIVSAIASVPGFEDFKGRTDRASLQEIAERQSTNIEDMFDTARQIGTDTSEAHSDWYPFVNRWSHEQAEALDTKPEAIMAAAAVLSPSADWANNVAWTKQVAQIVKDEKNIVAQPEWLAAQELAALSAHEFKLKTHERKNAKLVAEGKEPKPFTIEPPEIGKFAHLAGQKLSDLSPEDAAIVMRGAHEHFGKMVHQLGGMAGLGDPKNIATPQSIDNFAKAISILRNPSAENIDVQLGGNHKVRSFFQNMRDPLNTKYADVTVDSHHLGMAIGIPITGTHPIMKRIYDKPKRLATGLVGTYPITVEATRMATERINKKHGTKYTPAQVQSITWEAQRAMYDKKPASLITRISDLRSSHQRGEISRAQMLSGIESARLSGKDGKKSYKNPTLEEIRSSFLKEIKKGN